MYVYSFATVKVKLTWKLAIELYVKRNFLSVFLPAGGITALAYMPGSLRASAVHKREVHQASGIYAFTGFLSLFIVGVPVILYAIAEARHIQHANTGIIILTVLLASVVYIIYSIRNKGWIYKLIIKLFPSLEKRISSMLDFHFSKPDFAMTTLFSVGNEVSGIFHLYIAMLAVGLQPSLGAACTGYIVSVILLATSPFLRGLGAVELSLTYLLTLYGYTPAQALEITILYRIFEFWLPLIAGLLAFAAKGRQIFLRLAPAVLIFILGVVNILSAITPPIRERIRLLRQYLPMDTLHASNLLVLLMGLLLVVTATFLVRGLRNAWLIALVVSLLSCITHLTKALDWEEAAIAFFVVMVLLSTYKQYRLKSNPKLVNIGIITAVSLFVGVVLFETIGFYFIDVKHFQVDFTWRQSISYSIKSFFLLENSELFPLTRFGHEFLVSVNVLSVCTWIFFFYTFIRPYIQTAAIKDKSAGEAEALLTQYGSSSVDYYKLYDDKLLFISEEYEGFIAYRIANSFAIVLEEPVCAEENKINILREFDKQCRRMGLKPAFYRVDEDSMYYFETLKKKSLLIGQEAVMDIKQFTLEGKEKKSLRNGLNSLAKKGYTTALYEAPLNDQLMAELKAVSDEWLITYDKKEAVFSQGSFEIKEIRKHNVIAIRNIDNKVVAFLNIIPDYAPEECTYDLIRKTSDAPGGCMDALIIALIDYGKKRGLQWLNLGLVPMSGIDEPESAAERVVKFAYEKIKRFQHYQGLRDFKEKYATLWLNKYLVYENDFDLIQLPAALSKVMRPIHPSSHT
ncbi:MAG: phosphatidylglycerol lysyltransferase domain-containing protein, partial [Chitinophagaceae bacterium]